MGLDKVCNFLEQFGQQHDIVAAHFSMCLYLTIFMRSLPLSYKQEMAEAFEVWEGQKKHELSHKPAL